MKSRETEIARLNQWISERQEHLRKLQEKKKKRFFALCSTSLTPVYAKYNAKWPAWTEYTAHMSAAQEVAQGEVANLQQRVAFLERENSKLQSFLAPIRRLPTELLAEIL